MESEIYEVYQKLRSNNYTKEEIRPLLWRVYLISISLLKRKLKGHKISDKELTEKAINITADFITSNNHEKADLIMNFHIQDIEYQIDFEFLLYKNLKNLINNNFRNH